MDNNLSDIDKFEFELRCAEICRGKLPDTQEAFEAFAKRNGKTANIGKVSRLAVYAAVAAAACVAMFFVVHSLFFNTFSGGEQVYGAKVCDISDVMISVDGTTVSASDLNASRLGLSIDANNEIAVAPSDAADEVKMTEVAVPVGKTVTLLLPDGSKVCVGSNSRITFPTVFRQGEKRTVQLTGEAYFDVAHYDEWPFEVDCNGFTTKVLGTEFNVRNIEDEEPQVTLVHGRVAVSRDDYEVVLKPSQMACVSGTGGLSVRSADLDVVTSWKDGGFYFDGQTMCDILVEVGRWYNMDVIFCSKTHMNELIHFNAERGRPAKETVDCLNQISDANIFIRNDRIMVE